LLTTSGSAGLTNNTQATVATLTLTAGDWDVSGAVSFMASSAGAGAHNAFGLGLDAIDLLLTATFPAAALTQALQTGPKRYSVTASTAVHLRAQANFTGGTVSATGTARARRVR
jgi:hypothetical protein